MTTTSLTLLNLIQRADHAAWQRWASVYEPLLKYWLQRSAFQADVDDLTQEVLAVVSKRIREFEHNGRTGAFRAWLKAIACHAVSGYYRVRKNQRLSSGGVDCQAALADLADPQGDLSRLWDAEHDRFVARRLLEMIRSQFEPRTWQAFEQLMLHDQPASEVATQLGITTNAVFIAKSRVLSRLREEAAGLIDEWK
jgi:RNA polymerase sigma-70 factor (ECF subfamily)